MKYTAESLIGTSVDYARVTLGCNLDSDPQGVKALAQEVLQKIEGKEGQRTRTAVMRGIVRKADKVIEAQKGKADA